MKFRKWFAGLIGYVRDNGQQETAVEDDDANRSNSGNDNIRRNRMNVDPIPGQRKGFSVPVQVPVERPVVGPILVPCNGDGGVQGLRWYTERLRIDEDGDVADKFLHETSPAIQDEQEQPLQSFQVSKNTRQAKVRGQAFTPDGKLQHCVEYQRKDLWV